MSHGAAPRNHTDSEIQRTELTHGVAVSTTGLTKSAAHSTAIGPQATTSVKLLNGGHLPVASALARTKNDSHAIAKSNTHAIRRKPYYFGENTI